ncbi:hypothetical protein Trydic_g10525 [Trypoxylus dichotomus]
MGVGVRSPSVFTTFRRRKAFLTDGRGRGSASAELTAGHAQRTQRTAPIGLRSARRDPGFRGIRSDDAHSGTAPYGPDPKIDFSTRDQTSHVTVILMRGRSYVCALVENNTRITTEEIAKGLNMDFVIERDQ